MTATANATAADRLARHFSRLTPETITDQAKTAVKRLLLDYLGVALAGSQTESGRIAGAYALADGGQPQSTLIGGNGKAPAAQAAFANAIASHSIELDDIDVFAYFHFSPPVFSAALAAAEKAGASGAQLLAALAAGCEMMERVSRAANPSLRDRCYHSTPTCGVFGAAVAAGKLWGLSAEQMVSAIGLAGAQASGILEFHGHSMQKRFSPGPGARGGLTAAHLALLGFTGQDTVLEGPRGFLKAFTDEPDPSQLTAGLDTPYRLDIEFKPYSCARPIHNAIDCALQIRRRDEPRLEDIDAILVERHPSWAHKHQNKAPESYHAAQLSLHFSVAVALREGRALLDQYSDRNLHDPAIVRLMRITDIAADPSLPRGVSCRMTVTMKDGRRFSAQVDYPKGSIQVPMSDAEIEAKFTSLAAPVIGTEAAGELVERVRGIEHGGRVGELMALTQRRRQAGRV
ncbi:MmgE/PrpD family protein [Pigmentiphaga soli]|uniref:MmgE/PrpD family protein n=1 Tax=Pigmentiphaga soli TaxID=1007095 RepID=A0ABP8GZP4_9BURK